MDGGPADLDVAARWDAYLATTVVAELAPGTLVDLSGPDAVLDWPFGAAAHVVTAWNPFGRPRSDTANAAAHAALVERLDDLGVRWIHATGTDAAGSYREDGVLSTQLDTTTALALAEEHDQEAVFRIDADRIEVVGVSGGRTLARPRLALRLPGRSVAT